MTCRVTSGQRFVEPSAWQCGGDGIGIGVVAVVIRVISLLDPCRVPRYGGGLRKRLLVKALGSFGVSGSGSVRNAVSLKLFGHVNVVNVAILICRRDSILDGLIEVSRRVNCVDDFRADRGSPARGSNRRDSQSRQFAPRAPQLRFSGIRFVRSLTRPGSNGQRLATAVILHCIRVRPSKTRS